jgi:two-component sensor histidine kinase
LELAHRSKNLLAVIQGISNQTAKGSASIEEFTRRFSGRLMSLARAHDILSDQNWRGAGMRELIRTQVLLFAGPAGERVDYEGDALYLRPNAAQHIGLALHELTANALKHGALSSAAGRVRIRWRVSAEQESSAQRFTLSWAEEGGPAVSAPQVRHFGRILLEEVAPLSVQGHAKLDFAAGGIVYEMSMPVSELS